MSQRAATKLVCTIGPASEDRLPELLEAGMAVARLNLAHGTAAEHAAQVTRIREAARAAGREVAILADLPGPKVRLGPLAGGEAALEEGSTFTLTGGSGAPAEGDARGAGTTHPGLAGDLRPGDLVQLSDGVVELIVRSVDGTTVTTSVERGGTVRSGAGVNVPAERLSLPTISDRDRELAAMAVETGIDLVGQSFVRTAKDVADLRAILGPHGPAIVAKIETRPAVDAFDAIAAVADGVMVARGDLGLELPFEAVPVVQKRLLATCRRLGKPAIVATQMLESMLTMARPTRAEASDVANAVLDGADAVMLSGETAIGAYPVLAALAALRIAAAAEEGVDDPEGDAGVPVHGGGRAGDSLAIAATVLAANDPQVTVLVTAADGARGAAAAAAQRPHVPIVAVVSDARTARLLMAVRGVWPVIPSDPGLARDPGAAPAQALLADPAVRSALPATGRAVVVAGSAAGGGVDRIEALSIASAPDA